MLLLTPPGVYAAQGDTRLLIDSLRRESPAAGSRVLDIGTGSGAVAVAAARFGASVTAVDVSRRALAATVLNGALHRRRITVRHGDLLGPVVGQVFDVILSNPPYVPAASQELPSRGLARAWDAGPNGRILVDRICREAPSALVCGGALLMVHSALCGVAQTCDLLREAGLRTEVVGGMRQPFGPVMRARAQWFEEQGIIAAGQREEELVVIRGVRER